MLPSCLVYSLSVKMETTVLPKRRPISNGLHGVISKMIEFFITTAVRILDLKLHLKSAAFYVVMFGEDKVCSQTFTLPEEFKEQNGRSTWTEDTSLTNNMRSFILSDLT
jgi:hypothetical protein